MKAKQSNYDDYTGNIDLYVARIPVSKVFAITQKPAKNGRLVKVNMVNRLADYMNYVQYKRGKVKRWQNRKIPEREKERLAVLS